MLAWPLLLSNLTAPLLGLVDTAVVGHLDHPRYLAAVALGGNVFMFLYFSFNFLRMGTTGFASQARGGEKDTRVVLLRALLLSTVLGLGLIALSPLLRESGLWLLGGSDEVQKLAGDYINIRILGAPAALANFALIGFAIGTHNTRVPLKMTVLMHSTNALLDVLLVQVWHLDVRGVAIASATAEYVGLAGGLFWLRAALRPPARQERLWQPAAMLALMAVNRDIFLRSLALLSTFFFFTAQGARLGDAVLAANAVLITFLLLLSNLLDGFANSAEALVGDAHGRHDRQALRQAIGATGRWTVACAALGLIAFSLGGVPLIHLLTDLPGIRDTAITYLPWMLLLPLTASAGFWLDGIFVGATWGAAMRNTMLLAVGIFFVLWALTLGWENHGLWLAMNGFMAGRGILMGWVLKKRLAG
ncbi:MATE family efflux transporter [Alcanivorax sp. HI0033]|nr:MATE family efflux transporter [Alcanivorax sp. HI0003]KZX67433.1 MATE family efflux transporter [Alcanivorax sp. HI0007]KZX83043.1 MATE family efflux transporter [Alcanivorax sp. HI0011]KZX89443.1 MATE family efflux transporter [Alcanivorax sp. HI0013]KZY10850.1 MATE family efflux transporter [Alcanivorax sp. HI0033]KZY12744.1 MATE family efflux transporter [Alcanivorax sp. HI0035]